MTKKLNELIKERSCDPKWTIPVSALVQAPPYIALSMVLSRVAADPLSPFRSESFLTLTSLAHSDPTMTLPIVLGIMSMANVDTRNWWLTAAERERDKKYHEWKAAKAEKAGKPYIQSPLKSVLRGLSIARIGLAMLVPGVRHDLPPTLLLTNFVNRVFSYTGSRRQLSVSYRQ
jgi:inner membrane protein COX18